MAIRAGCPNVALLLIAILGVGCGTRAPVSPTAATAGWQPAVRLAPTDDRAVCGERPAVAADALGRALAVWCDRPSGASIFEGERVMAARFEPQAGWVTPVTVDSQASGGTPGYSFLSLDMNRQGVAAMAWGHAGAYPRRSAFFFPMGGWSAPRSMSGVVRGGYPRLAVTETDQAIALWEGNLDGPGPWWQWERLMAATLSPESGWLREEQISSQVAPGYQPFRIAVDGHGNATAAWTQSGPSSIHGAPAAVWANRRPRGERWGEAQRLGLLPYVDTYASGGVAVAVNDAGAAIVVWQGARSLEAAHFVPEHGWTDPEEVGGPPAVPPIDVVVHLEASGRAVAVWNTRLRVEAAAYEPRRGWSGPVPAEVSGERVESELGAGFDDTGRAWVVWVRGGRIVASRFGPDEAWDPLLALSGSSTALAPALAVSPSGQAVVVWLERIGADTQVYEVWSTTYRPEGP
jgi:hypothetical protein